MDRLDNLIKTSATNLTPRDDAATRVMRDIQKRRWGRLVPTSRFALPMLAFLMSGLALAGTASYAYYQSNLRPALSRAQLEQRVARQIAAARANNVGLNINEGEIPREPAGISLPSCETTTAELCMYNFGVTNGGEAIVVSEGYFADEAKMRRLAETLFAQTKQLNFASRTPIYSKKIDALNLPLLVQISQDHRQPTATEQAQLDLSTPDRPFGQWNCGSESGCDLEYNYWPGATVADWSNWELASQHVHTLILSKPTSDTPYIK